VKLLRTIALDPSDTFVFDVPAEPGEWAVSGAFRFCDQDPSVLEGKDRWAFRGGFLGLRSWGWSTLVQIVEATEVDRSAAVELLASRLVERLGAPDRASALAAAAEEIAFAQSLCTHPTGTLVAVHRTVVDGDLREAFRVLKRREGVAGHGKAFAFIEIDDGEIEQADRSFSLAELGGEADRS
jgi:hypothetical protein